MLLWFLSTFQQICSFIKIFTHKSNDSEEIRRDFVQMKVKTPSGVMVLLLLSVCDQLYL